MLDGDYVATGPNPYQYPGVAAYSAFQLTDVIFDVRERLATQGGIDVPIFAAHSLADVTTLYSGIESLTGQNKGDNVLFKIPKDINVCHADVVVSQQQLVDMNFDRSAVEEPQAALVTQGPRAPGAFRELVEGLPGCTSGADP